MYNHTVCIGINK